MNRFGINFYDEKGNYIMTSFMDAMENQEPHLKIANHYKECFELYGATPKGLDWDNQENLNKRYEIMFDLISSKEISHIINSSLLDFGCGYGGFYNWLTNKTHSPQYSGIDINENCINKARELYPNQFFGLLDIHGVDPEYWFRVRHYDYIICNGTFTIKNNLTQEEMTNFMCSTLEKLWTKTNKGIAFNCMSKILDYERDDLFHVSFDELSMWVYDNLSSKFTIRQDYGLREFTMYVYK
jgi:SAM-dependent methyltransferase